MEKISLRNRKDQTIVGILEKPTTGTIHGTVIIEHGYGGFKEQEHIQVIQKAFLENGFIIFNFDLTNTFGESDGNFEKATLGFHTEDFEDVAEWAQKQDWFVHPLAVTGHSMGGYACARYAEKFPEKVSYCLPIAPLVSGKLSWDAHQEFKPKEFVEWKEKGVIEEESKSRPGVIIKRKPWSHMEERLHHDLLPDAHELTMPVFLFVGTEDTSIPPKHIQILFDAIPEGDKTLVLSQGAPHTYKTKKDIHFLKESIDTWLKKNVTQ